MFPKKGYKKCWRAHFPPFKTEMKARNYLRSPCAILTYNCTVGRQSPEGPSPSPRPPTHPPAHLIRAQRGRREALPTHETQRHARRDHEEDEDHVMSVADASPHPIDAYVLMNLAFNNNNN